MFGAQQGRVGLSLRYLSPRPVKTFFSCLLISLVLLQTFSREVLVVDFTLNRATITARFCVNKARPQLHCDGQCYFAKKLKQQEDRENKAPNPLKEQLEMLPVAFQSLVPAAPRPPEKRRSPRARSPSGGARRAPGFGRPQAAFRAAP
jgi:hypothetical protein